jgi:hypothetical protein
MIPFGPNFSTYSCKKIACTTRYESLFFSLICLINSGYALVNQSSFMKKSMTFITSCTNNYFASFSSYLKYWMIQKIVEKYCNYVRKFMWQLCGWGGVDICMTFHKRAFDFQNFENWATMNR